MKEGNLISFKVIIDERGRLNTELSFFPESEIVNVFSDIHTQNYIRNILRESHVKLDPLHDYLEKQLQAL
jgi:hypothetical protein|tara:strand:+ start:102 stop:311 length:210 start_codon:yes stop_codon:yes gene_type:complete